jgi:hypothetical protein
VSLLGEPRATLDVDVSVWAAPDQLAAALDCLCARFRMLRPNPREFVEKYRVLPIATAAGVRADVVLRRFRLSRRSFEELFGNRWEID